ncbi:MAG: hypothetical protein JJU13_02925 [Balneolaceae bacterium]|nr:hypothetical protein [Balneolaceae bacterium]
MDGFLSDPFIKKLPGNLKASWLPGKSAYSVFYKSISRGYLQVAASDENFITFIEDLRKTEPELAKALISLESSGKLRTVQIDTSLPKELNVSGIRISEKKHISGGFTIPTDTIFHDQFDNPDSRQKITDATQKPLFIEHDLSEGTIEYLFNERSFCLNIGDTFNWARFIIDYALPFKKIRILDPYLYKNIDNVDLNGLLKTVTKKSDCASIEIISNGSEKQIAKFKNELIAISGLKADIRLYNQLSDVSDTFHKRLIWTDFWVLFAERGFDFLKLERGLGTVKKETNLFLTGKYAAKNSIWYQLVNSWQGYLDKCTEVFIN